MENRPDTRTRTTIKSFPGASVADCYHYFKLPLDTKPDEVIIHVGTNDLKTNSARSTEDSIVDLASWTASERPTTKISISEDITRKDQDGLGCKVKEVNKSDTVGRYKKRGYTFQWSKLKSRLKRPRNTQNA